VLGSGRSCRPSLQCERDIFVRVLARTALEKASRSKEWVVFSLSGVFPLSSDMQFWGSYTNV
jgi:hypothetical protein